MVGILVIGGSSFWYGRHYEQGQNLSASALRSVGFTGGGTRSARGGGGRGQGAGGFLTGDIIAKDDMSITVKMRSPQNASSSPSTVGAESGSKIIFFSGTTDIGKQTKGSTNDLTTGETVMVTGTPNPDGSLTASSIQIRSVFSR